MTHVDTPAALLAELTAQGIELQARGDRLCFRPRKAMTPQLVARVKAHKPELLALITNTKTPAGDSASVGFGCGDRGDVLTAASYTTDETKLLADAPAGLRATVGAVMDVFGGHVVEVRTPRQHLADLILGARRRGDHARALDRREAWRERRAIIQFDGGLPRPQAEANAVADLLRMETMNVVAN